MKEGHGLWFFFFAISSLCYGFAISSF